MKSVKGVKGEALNAPRACVTFSRVSLPPADNLSDFLRAPLFGQYRRATPACTCPHGCVSQRVDGAIWCEPPEQTRRIREHEYGHCNHTSTAIAGIFRLHREIEPFEQDEGRGYVPESRPDDDALARMILDEYIRFPQETLAASAAAEQRS